MLLLVAAPVVWSDAARMITKVELREPYSAATTNGYYGFEQRDSDIADTVRIRKVGFGGKFSLGSVDSPVGRKRPWNVVVWRCRIFNCGIVVL